MLRIEILNTVVSIVFENKSHKGGAVGGGRFWWLCCRRGREEVVKEVKERKIYRRGQFLKVPVNILSLKIRMFPIGVQFGRSASLRSRSATSSGCVNSELLYK